MCDRRCTEHILLGGCAGQLAGEVAMTVVALLLLWVLLSVLVAGGVALMCRGGQRSEAAESWRTPASRTDT